MRAAIFDEESKGQKYEWSRHPRRHQAPSARSCREKMIEACADVDDDIMAKFLDGDLDRGHRGRDRRGAPQGVLQLQVLPRPLRIRVQEQGRPADARRGRQLPPVAARHPAGQGDRTRTTTRKRSARPTTRSRSPRYAFKIINDPHGNLTFFRVYSGTLTSGHDGARTRRAASASASAASCACTRTSARSSPRPTPGNIYAAVGLKRHAHRRHALRREASPILLEKMIFPEPVISIAIEPKTKADVEKLGVGLQKLAAEDPSFRMHTDEESGQTIISGMGELHLDIIVRPPEARVQGRDQRRQARGRLPRGDHEEGPAASTSTPSSPAGAASTATSLMEIEPGERGDGLRLRQRRRRRRHPEGVHPRDREGRARGDGARRPRRLPGRRHEVPPLRRQLPRRRLERAGVRGRAPRSASRTARSARGCTSSSRS